MVAAVDALQTLFRAPPDPGVHPGGRNIAYDLALVKLGAHAKFGEDWSNGVDFYTGHTNTQTHTPGFNFIYKIQGIAKNNAIPDQSWKRSWPLAGRASWSTTKYWVLTLR